MKEIDIPKEEEIIALQKYTLQQVPNASDEIKQFLLSLNKGFATGVTLNNEQLSVDQAIAKIEQNVHT